MTFLRATAAHCVTNDLAELAVLDGFDGNSVVFQTLAGAVGASFSSADIMVHPQYDGDVRNGFDIAIVDLGQALPEGIARYALNDGSIDETGAHLAAGFGRSGDGGAGAILGAGSLRLGFNNFLAAGLPIGAINNRQTQLTADFDAGSSANDAFGFFDQALFGAAVDDPFNQGLGFGLDEVGIAPGDSGGPTFLLGAGGPAIVCVHSYGLRLELSGGITSDLDGSLNSSFGEFQVDARVLDREVLGFIGAIAVPEPTGTFPVGVVAAVLIALGCRTSAARHRA